MSLASQVSDAIERPPAQPRPWNAARIAGAAFLAFWAVIGVVLIVYLAGRWNPELFTNYAPKYMQGLWVTIRLVVISMILGGLLSIPIAYGRMSKNRIASALAYAYVYFFRGTPLLAQTFLIYYGLGSFRPQLEALGLWGFLREAWYCAILAFSLNTAAYQAEILRGAIQSIPRGQWEGAAALGLSKWQTMRKIIAPQAMIVGLRPYGNELILMIKGSAIVSIITVYDLMGETRRAFSRSFDFQTYIWAAIIYLTMVEMLRHVIDWVERRITKHLIR
ncbi:MAG: ABC transporter permease [Rhizobiaceae bacterium]|nr:ABC transporter permease [Rhizobiaceae bacterium]